MKVPDKYRDYECTEYFIDGWAESGYFDDKSQTQIVTPLGEAYEDREIGFFAVGRSGADSIDFGYRRGHVGLWAFHPIDQEFQLMAVTITELVDGWCSGKMAV